MLGGRKGEGKKGREREGGEREEEEDWNGRGRRRKAWARMWRALVEGKVKGCES